MTDTVTARHTDVFNYFMLTDEQIKRYGEEGYLNIGSTLTHQGLELMRQEVMQAWSAEKDAFDPNKTWLNNALLPNIHHRSDVVRRYYFSGPLVDIARQVIGPNIKAATSQLTFKMRGNTQPFAWHQDNAYGELDPYSAISCLTALDDTDVGNGCLWLVPGSHQQGQCEVSRTKADKGGNRPVELTVDDSLGVPMPVKAGECFFFHCHMLHKSQGNLSKDRDRRILFMRYADADAVEVYDDRRPRLGRLLCGTTRFPEVEAYEADLPLD